MLRSKIIQISKSKYAGRTASERIDAFIKSASMGHDLDDEHIVRILSEFELDAVFSKESPCGTSD